MMSLVPSFIIPFLLLFATLASALGQTPTITFAANSSTGTLKLSGRNQQILVSDDDWWGVVKAANDLAIDFGRVAGENLTVAAAESGVAGKVYTYRPAESFTEYTLGPAVNITAPAYALKNLSSVVIIAGTIGTPFIDNLVANSSLDVSSISGKWEAFQSSVVESPMEGVERALVIIGSTPRGTIFGLYDVSEQIGVSPWYWWADVPQKQREGVWALNTSKVQGEPSVKYRGLFINDEQPGLTNWINVNYAPGKYGPGFNHYFYSHVFELLLRLKANYFWPAMWGSMFNIDDTENQPLADAYGILMGTSHTEPMMRATNEWSTFGNGSWEWDTNNASIYPFFAYGAQRAKPYNNSLFTMAMRGSGDTAIQLSTEFAVQTLENVVANQTAILEEVYSDRNVEEIPQMWCLYKEVQGYYESGMDVPDYITLLWADDNWGNTRRLPLPNETSRAGGAGVYYHYDYVGSPRNYKWINTIQLEKTVEQMQLAKERQADRIWILNVGDLKNLEMPIEHFMDLAYDTSRWDYDSVLKWLTLWASREFGETYASNISSIMDRYGMYAARRKYELLDRTIYSLINYGEADAVLMQWQDLADEAMRVYDGLGEGVRSAFFELVLHPVLAGGTVNRIHVEAARNTLYVEQKRNSANAVARGVMDAFVEDQNLTNTYHSLLDGKWNHILDQPHLGYDGYWQQPMRNTMPYVGYVQTLETSVAGSLGIGVEGSNATVSGDDAYHTNGGNTLVLPPLDTYGPLTRYIDVFSRGTSSCSFTITPTAPYVTAFPSSGIVGVSNSTSYLTTINDDIRVYLSVDWTLAPPAPNSSVVNINITSSCDWGNYAAPTIQLPVNSTILPPSFTTGFAESDGHISIEASHFTRNISALSNTTNPTNSSIAPYYAILPNHGRTLAGMHLLPVTTSTQTPTLSSPSLEYDIYIFSPTSIANITTLLSPSLNNLGSSRPLKYAIGIDDEIPQVVQPIGFFDTDGTPPWQWTGGVSDGVWGLVGSGKTTTTSHNLGNGTEAVGKHTIKLWALEPGVVFQKLLVDVGGLRESYLGPPESFRVGVDQVGEYDGRSVYAKGY